MKWLAETLEVDVLTKVSRGHDGGGENGSGDPPEGSGDLESMEPKEFMVEKSPTTDVERVTCLGYYLTKTRGMNSFETSDITELNTEAAGHRLSNPAQAMRNAIHQRGYLAQAKGGKKQITAWGEKVVEAMPNREAVKRVQDQVPKRRKRSAAKRKKKTS